MSWAVSYTGTPAELVTHLRRHAVTLSDQSKAEYDAILPYLVGLVSENHGIESRQLIVQGFGAGTYKEGIETSKVCNVTIKDWDPLV